MTLPASDAKEQYSGDGIVVFFAFPNFFPTDGDLKVFETDTNVTPNVTTETTTGITKAGAGLPAGGSVTYAVAPLSGIRVTLLRQITFSQDTDYQTAEGFPANAHEAQADRQVMMSQQLDEKFARTPFFDEGLLDAFDSEIPLPVASRALIVNATGTGWDFSDSDVNDLDSAVADATAQAAASAASASASAVSAAAAAVSETNAATSETNAATSETNAATSETNAAASAAEAASNAQALAVGLTAYSDCEDNTGVVESFDLSATALDPDVTIVNTSPVSVAMDNYMTSSIASAHAQAVNLSAPRTVFPGKGFSVGGWFYVDSSPTSGLQQMEVNVVRDSGATAVLGISNNTAAGFGIRATSPGGSTAEYTFSFGSWHQAIATLDGNGELKLYIDAVLKETASITAPSAANVDSLNTRCLFVEAIEWRGDGLSVHNRVLSQSQVTEFYNSGSGRAFEEIA